MSYLTYEQGKQLLDLLGVEEKFPDEPTRTSSKTKDMPKKESKRVSKPTVTERKKSTKKDIIREKVNDFRFRYALSSIVKSEEWNNVLNLIFLSPFFYDETEMERIDEQTSRFMLYIISAVDNETAKKIKKAIGKENPIRKTLFIRDLLHASVGKTNPHDFYLIMQATEDFVFMLLRMSPSYSKLYAKFAGAVFEE